MKKVIAVAFIAIVWLTFGTVVISVTSRHKPYQEMSREEFRSEILVSFSCAVVGSILTYGVMKSIEVISKS